MKTSPDTVDIAKIEAAIKNLKAYVDDEGINPFISILAAIQQEPSNESHLLRLQDSFNNLGILRGAVLTYAPSIYELIANDPFGDERG